MLLLAFLLMAQPVEGDAAFSHRIRSAAEARGLELDGPGCALALDCSKLGDDVWIRVGAAWTGPWRVVDCGAAHDRAWLRERGRVVDLPWRWWKAVGLPLRPFPVAVAYREPDVRPL